MGHDWGSNEHFNSHGNLSRGSKVGQIRSYGIRNDINCLFLCDFSYLFSPLKNTISPQIFKDFFSIKQDTFLILKLLITFLKESVVGQWSLWATDVTVLVRKLKKKMQSAVKLIFKVSHSNRKCTAAVKCLSSQN